MSKDNNVKIGDNPIQKEGASALKALSQKIRDYLEWQFKYGWLCTFVGIRCYGYNRWNHIGYYVGFNKDTFLRINWWKKHHDEYCELYLYKPWLIKTRYWYTTNHPRNSEATTHVFRKRYIWQKDYKVYDSFTNSKDEEFYHQEDNCLKDINSDYRDEPGINETYWGSDE